MKIPKAGFMGFGLVLFTVCVSASTDNTRAGDTIVINDITMFRSENVENDVVVNIRI